MAIMKSKLFIYVALGADLLIGITKFVGAALTRSSAMISEGIHSIVDSGNQVLTGIKSSKKKSMKREHLVMERNFTSGRLSYHL
jgi:divalent metal cation (Fe/Co/Zn/Cd) transporter